MPRKAGEDNKSYIERITKAADQGDAEAQTNLGVCYENGEGIEKNDKKAIEWYQKAANQGYAKAQFYLGLNYEYGIGVEQNKKTAVEWYQKAAAQGDKDAQIAIIKLNPPVPFSINKKPKKSAIKSGKKDKKQSSFGLSENLEVDFDLAQVPDSEFEEVRVKKSEFMYKKSKLNPKRKIEESQAAHQAAFEAALAMGKGEEGIKDIHLFRKSKEKEIEDAEKLSKNAEAIQPAINKLIDVVESFSKEYERLTGNVRLPIPVEINIEAYKKAIDELRKQTESLKKTSNSEKGAKYLECFKAFQAQTMVIFESPLTPEKSPLTPKMKALALETLGALSASLYQQEKPKQEKKYSETSVPSAASSSAQPSSSAASSKPTTPFVTTAEVKKDVMLLGVTEVDFSILGSEQTQKIETVIRNNLKDALNLKKDQEYADLEFSEGQRREFFDLGVRLNDERLEEQTLSETCSSKESELASTKIRLDEAVTNNNEGLIELLSSKINNLDIQMKEAKKRMLEIREQRKAMIAEYNAAYNDLKRGTYSPKAKTETKIESKKNIMKIGESVIDLDELQGEKLIKRIDVLVKNNLRDAINIKSAQEYAMLNFSEGEIREFFDLGNDLKKQWVEQQAQTKEYISNKNNLDDQEGKLRRELNPLADQRVAMIKTLENGISLYTKKMQEAQNRILKIRDQRKNTLEKYNAAYQRLNLGKKSKSNLTPEINAAVQPPGAKTPSRQEGSSARLAPVKESIDITLTTAPIAAAKPNELKRDKPKDGSIQEPSLSEEEQIKRHDAFYRGYLYEIIAKKLSDLSNFANITDEQKELIKYFSKKTNPKEYIEKKLNREPPINKDNYRNYSYRFITLGPLAGSEGSNFGEIFFECFGNDKTIYNFRSSGFGEKDGIYVDVNVEALDRFLVKIERSKSYNDLRNELLAKTPEDIKDYFSDEANKAFSSSKLNWGKMPAASTPNPLASASTVSTAPAVVATPTASIAPTMTSAAPVSSASPASSVPSSSKKPKVKKTKLSQKAKHELQVMLSNVLKYNFSDDHPFKNDIIKMNLKIRNRKGWIYDDKYENEVEARKDVESVVKLQKGLLELDVNIVRTYIKNEIKKNAKKLIKYFDYLNVVYEGKPINIEKTDTENKISSLIAEAAKKANDLKNDVVNKSVQGIKNQWLEYTEAMNKVEAAWESYESKYLRSLPLSAPIVPSPTLTSRPVTSVAASISTSSAFTAASSAAAPKTLAPTPAPSVPTAAPSTPILELQKEIADLAKKVEEKSADEKDRTRLAAAKSDLGRFYYDGIGVKKDYQKAFKLFIDAANLGNIDAIYNLGLCYQQGNAVDINFKVAFEIFNKAAQKGHIGAINSIGICYSKGIGVEQNDGLAAKAFEKAAKGGNADAQFDLAESYYNGTGIEENEEQALKWYQLSAAQGNAKAQYKLGYFYEHGREPHVKKNINQAIEWYKKAEKSDSDSVFANFAKIALQKLAASSPSEISTDGSIPKPLAVNASLEKKRDNKSSTVSFTQTRPDVLEEGSIEITLKPVETPEPVLTSKPRESKEDKPRKTQTAPLEAKPSASEPSVRPKESEKRPDLYAFKKDQLEARQQHLAKIKKTMEETKGHSTQPITFEDYKAIHEKSKAQLLKKISEEGKREGSPYFNVSVAETQPMDLKVLIPNESGGNDILTRSFKEKDDKPEVEVTLSGNSENAIFQMIATNSDPKLRPLELDPGSDPETILKILETAKEAGWEIPKDLNHKDYEKTLSEDPRYQDRYEKVLSVGPSPDSDDDEGLGVTIRHIPKK